MCDPKYYYMDTQTLTLTYYAYILIALIYKYTYAYTSILIYISTYNYTNPPNHTEHTHMNTKNSIEFWDKNPNRRERNIYTKHTHSQSHTKIEFYWHVNCEHLKMKWYNIRYIYWMQPMANFLLVEMITKNKKTKLWKQ